MGEEKKEAATAEKKEEVKEEKEKEEENKKKEEEIKEIVVKVDMHCEACARKVARALKGFQGVDEVRADCKASKVVVKGKGAVDPMEVCRRIQKKTSRKVELVSPLPPPKTKQEQEEEDKKKKKEEEEEEKKKKDGQTKQDKKPEPPPVITVVLKVWMHCEACAHRLQKKIRKVEGVESVTADIANGRVLVKGVLDPEKLVKDVYKKTGKHALVVKDEEKKEEVKKDEEKKDEEKQDENKDPEENKEDDDKKTNIKKMEHWPSKYYMEHYSYAPQIFSDENPNACTVM